MIYYKKNFFLFENTPGKYEKIFSGILISSKISLPENSETISDIEQQSYANISTKVLVESLVVRWKQVCSGSTTVTVG